jgi:hypothetical protein
MARYAENTTVASDRSRAEIERTLTRYKAQATAQMIPVAAKDAASLKGSRNRLYRAHRTPWQPVEPTEHDTSPEAALVRQRPVGNRRARNRPAIDLRDTEEL